MAWLRLVVILFPIALVILLTAFSNLAGRRHSTTSFLSGKTLVNLCPKKVDVSAFCRNHKVCNRTDKLFVCLSITAWLVFLFLINLEWHLPSSTTLQNPHFDNRSWYSFGQLQSSVCDVFTQPKLFSKALIQYAIWSGEVSNRVPVTIHFQT